MTEFSTETDLAALQRERLAWALAHAYENGPFFRAKFAQAGLRPAAIRTPADLVQLPFSTKEELRGAYPLGWAAVPPERIARIHASSGTTGKRTVAYYTARDLDDWTALFARCYRLAGVGPGDRVQVTPGYGLWTAGISFQLGAERAGAMAVPVGPGNVELQLELMEDLQTTVLVATSSFALLLGEEVAQRGLRERLALRTGIFGSERWGDRMRARINSLLGVDSYDLYGLTELYGPGMGVECKAHMGIHYWADAYVVELIDPETGEPTAPGATGEIVLTTLHKEAMPLLRYRTRDLTRLLPGPCACGSPYPRFDRLSGRSDDMVKVRGVALYPSQVDTLLAGLEQVSSEYQLVVERDGARDELTLRVECQLAPDAASAAALGEHVAQQFRAHVGLTPRVELLPLGALPRTDRKTRRVFDRRED